MLSAIKRPPTYRQDESIKIDRSLHVVGSKMHALTFLALLSGASTSTRATLLHTDFPHLLIALKSSEPRTAFGTAPDANITYSNATGEAQYTELSFDVPSNEAAICRMAFKINTSPTKKAPRALSGEAPYALSISRTQPAINKDTDTWNDHPAVTEYYATFELTPSGEVKEVYSKWFECPKGQVAQFLLHPGSARDLSYYWFELDYSGEQGGPHGVVLEMHT